MVLRELVCLLLFCLLSSRVEFAQRIKGGHALDFLIKIQEVFQQG